VGVFAVAALLISGDSAKSESPTVAYIFPAGGQRGATVPVRIGGHFLHGKAEFTIGGTGLTGRSPIERIPTTWFEGPLILQPASQQKEDYPKDYAGELKIAADAPLGVRYWNCSTSQGITPGMRFVVGNLPEVIEEEVDGLTPAKPVTLPVTINGRIFPREDVDDWSFVAKANEIVSCEVNAARLGSGLDSRLEVLNPRGEVIAENSDTFGTDSFVRFTAPEDGTYTVRIHDIRFEGLQHFVYRLTISAGPWLDRVYPLGGQRGKSVELQLSGANLSQKTLPFAVAATDTTQGLSVFQFPAEHHPFPVLFETDDFAEQLEAEPNDDAAQAKTGVLPGVFNGRIDRAGDVDLWKFNGKKGEAWLFDLRASRLGSPLDGVLTLLDEKGQKLATADDLSNGQTDAVLTATLPADGVFTLKVEERISSRGGSEFAYRVRVVKPSESSLRLTTALDAVTLNRGGEVKVKVLADRPAGFAEEIPLEFEGLPEGMTVTGKLGKGQNQVDVVLKAADTAKIATSKLRIVGKWKVGDQERSAAAVIQRPLGEPEVNELLLRISVPTPFKLKGIFATKYAPRGSVFTRDFRVDRNGFTGPLWVEIADRQARHLQGVVGPHMDLTAEQSEFQYPFTLPSNMEIGRTSRTCVAVLGEVVDADGTKHIVSHTSQEQNEQAIVIVDPGRLSIESSVRSVRRVPNSEVRIPFRINRGVGLRGAVRIELVSPKSVRGLICDAVEIPADSGNGILMLRFSAEAAPDKAAGPECSLKLRATMTDEHGFPVTDEAEARLISDE
ncbi:MAG: PPC domain-containing protein, partial [Planctomycetaceae bacterium]|nr:PPC domain-containing protein [Planctomycetaceae bacterium]